MQSGITLDVVCEIDQQHFTRQCHRATAISIESGSQNIEDLGCSHAPSPSVLCIQIEPPPTPCPVATIFSSFSAFQHMLATLPFPWRQPWRRRASDGLQLTRGRLDQSNFYSRHRQLRELCRHPACCCMLDDVPFRIAWLGGGEQAARSDWHGGDRIRTSLIPSTTGFPSFPALRHADSCASPSLSTAGCARWRRTSTELQFARRGRIEKRPTSSRRQRFRVKAKNVAKEIMYSIIKNKID
jgi:hypothetical protein